MSRNSNWNERELTLALALYYRVPATKISGTNPMLKDASAYIGRSSSAIALSLQILGPSTGTQEKGLEAFLTEVEPTPRLWSDS